MHIGEGVKSHLAPVTTQAILTHIVTLHVMQDITSNAPANAFLVAYLQTLVCIEPLFMCVEALSCALNPLPCALKPYFPQY